MTRIVGILGPTYCGSTLVNYILGALPGCRSVGEARWLIDDPTAFPPDFPILTIPGCTAHGVECPVFTPEVVAKLRSPAPDYYRRLAALVGNPQVLVVADKYPVLYERLGLPDVFLLVFKDPRAQVASLRRRGAETVDAAVNAACDIYDACLRMQAWRPAVAVSIEDIVAEPGPVVSRLATRVGLQPDPGALRFWEADQCLLGGNFLVAHHQHDHPDRPDGWVRLFRRRFAVDDRWRTELTPGEIEHVLQHPRITETWSMLRELERATIRGDAAGS